MTCKLCVTCRHITFQADKAMCRLGEAFAKDDVVFGGKVPTSAYQMRGKGSKCGPEAALWEPMPAAPDVAAPMLGAGAFEVKPTMWGAALAALVGGAAVVWRAPARGLGMLGGAWDGVTARVHRAWMAFHTVEDNTQGQAEPPAQPAPDAPIQPAQEEAEPVPTVQPEPDGAEPEKTPVPPAEVETEAEPVAGSVVPFQKPEASASGQALGMGVVAAAILLLLGFMIPEMLYGSSVRPAAAALVPCPATLMQWGGESCCQKGDDGWTRCRRCRQAASGLVWL